MFGMAAPNAHQVSLAGGPAERVSNEDFLEVGEKFFRTWFPDAKTVRDVSEDQLEEFVGNKVARCFAAGILSTDSFVLDAAALVRLHYQRRGKGLHEFEKKFGEGLKSGSADGMQSVLRAGLRDAHVSLSFVFMEMQIVRLAQETEEERRQKEEERRQKEEAEKREEDAKKREEEAKKKLRDVVTTMSSSLDTETLGLNVSAAMSPFADLQRLLPRLIVTNHGKFSDDDEEFLAESALQKYTIKKLCEIKDAKLVPIDYSQTSVLYKTDKPDVLFCDPRVVAACWGAGAKTPRCSYAMVCAVLEIKLCAFAKNDGRLLTKGLEALGHISRRGLRMDYRQRMLGIIMDQHCVQIFRKAESNNYATEAKWECFPAKPLRLDARDETLQFSGWDLLASIVQCCSEDEIVQPFLPDSAKRTPTFYEHLARLREALSCTTVVPITRFYGRNMLAAVKRGAREWIVKCFMKESDRDREYQALSGLQEVDRVAKLKVSTSSAIVPSTSEKSAGEHSEEGPGLPSSIDTDVFLMHMEDAGELTLKAMLGYLRKHKTVRSQLVHVRYVISTLGLTLLSIHREGLVHCDVKPSNVVLSNRIKAGSFEPTLIDFEHCVKVDTRIKGYSTNFCAKEIKEAVARKRASESESSQSEDENEREEAMVTAKYRFDMESLFYTALHVLVSEVAYISRFDALTNPDVYWADVEAVADLWKNLPADSRDPAREFLKAFGAHVRAEYDSEALKEFFEAQRSDCLS